MNSKVFAVLIGGNLYRTYKTRRMAERQAEWFAKHGRARVTTVELIATNEEEVVLFDE